MKLLIVLSVALVAFSGLQIPAVKTQTNVSVNITGLNTAIVQLFQAINSGAIGQVGPILNSTLSGSVQVASALAQAIVQAEVRMVQAELAAATTVLGSNTSLSVGQLAQINVSLNQLLTGFNSAVNQLLQSNSTNATSTLQKLTATVINALSQIVTVTSSGTSGAVGQVQTIVQQAIQNLQATLKVSAS